MEGGGAWRDIARIVTGERVWERGWEREVEKPD